MSTELLVGAATVTITPEHGRPMGGYASRTSAATGTLDELMCRVVVLRKDAATLVIVALDLVYAPAPLCDLIASGIAVDLGIERSAVMVCATHTHCGPAIGATAENADLFAQITAAAIRCATQAGRAAEPGTLRRRTFSLAGSVRNRRDAEAVVDETGSVLFAVTPAGAVIASIVGFACHPTVLEGDTVAYSRDYPGVVCDTVEQICGGTAVFLQGFAGDVNPVFHDHSVQDMQLFGKQLGVRASNAVLDGLRDARPAFTINLSSDAVLPVAAHGSSDPLQIDGLRAGILDVEVEPRAETGPDAARAALDAAYAAERDAPLGEERERAVARRQACWIDALMASRPGVLGIDYPGAGPERLPVQVFRLGPQLRIIALPGEPMTGTARRLRASLGDDVLLVGYANGAPSYLPPEDEFENHGYEVGSTRYAKGTVERLAEAAVQLVADPFIAERWHNAVHRAQ
jgi:neutral ceramidase